MLVTCAPLSIAAFKALYDVEADCAGMDPKCGYASGNEDPSRCPTGFCNDTPSFRGPRL
jgi:hypothetical protein